MRHSEAFEALVDTLKLAVATLRDREIPFMLGGSLAAWARGGPEPQNDLDLMVKPQDADAALKALAEAGMRIERPPEEWLYKAWNGEVLVDLPEGQAFGQVEYDLRDLAHDLAASSHQAGLAAGKKRGTRAPAASARTARPTPASSTTGPRPG